MGYTIVDREMEVALRKMLQEMFPQVPISRSGVAMLAAEIDALEEKCITMRLIVEDDSRRDLN